jgi:hypothetical protein
MRELADALGVSSMTPYRYFLAGLRGGSKLDARTIAKPAVEALGKYFGLKTDI